MYDQLIDRLIEAGFAPKVGDEENEEDARRLGLVAHAGEHDLFTVEVKTHEWGWSKERGSYTIEKDHPEVTLYLPHSCDEWEIAPYGEGDGRDAANSFSVGAVDAALLFNRTLDLINEVQSTLNEVPS